MFLFGGVKTLQSLDITIIRQFCQFTVARDNQIAVVFYSDKMRTFPSEITNIQFDGTFFTVPVQFSQLWTIFASVGRHTLLQSTV